MTSRERTLAAIHHREADRVPIFLRGVAAFASVKGHRDRIDQRLALGLDDKMTLALTPRFHPEVTVRDWLDDQTDPRYRLAWREYQTPRGPLKMGCRCTEDCRYQSGVPLQADENVSRAVEFLVKGRDDLPRLAYLLQPPDDRTIARFRTQAREEQRFAADRGVLVEGWGGPAGDLAMYLCGPDLLYAVQDDPGFGEELVEMSYAVDLRCMAVILDAGVDLIDTRGCYETAPLWSPAWHERLFAPRLARKADLAHQAGAVLSYFSSGNFMPHLDALLRCGVDIINCIRPFPGGVNDMRTIKARVGRRMCLWGGINPEEDIERATRRHIRAAVIDVLLAAGQGGGFVMSTGGGLYDPNCREQVMTFIEAAREFGRYPLDVAWLTAELERN